MSACEFNLSRYAERLEVAGVPREQALVHAELIAEVLQRLVTKDQLREELAAVEARLMGFVRSEIRGEASSLALRIEA